MLLVRTDKLPEAAEWRYEVKLDGYRAVAIKTAGKVQLRSRDDNDFSTRYPGIVGALAPVPDETAIDGEVVTLDETGKPSFNTLQNFGSAGAPKGAPLHFYVFGLLILAGDRGMPLRQSTRSESRPMGCGANDSTAGQRFTAPADR
jgi:bifunctional non-homologous end joining protein LigD